MKNNFLILFLFTTLFCQAQESSMATGFWNDYYGTLGDREISMTIHPSDNGQLIGNYYFTDQELPIKIQFKGTLEKNEFTLSEQIVNDSIQSQSNSITGTLYLDKEGFDKVSGTWTNQDKSQTLDLQIQRGSYGWGLPGQRYVGFEVSDNVVEEYAQKVKSAILNKDKEWLADQLIYPSKAHVKGKKITIKNEKEFKLKYFDILFHDEFLAILKTIKPLNLWHSNDALMMGDGQIWIFRANDSRNTGSTKEIAYINWLAT